MRKSETAVQSDHVLKFVYDKDAQFIRGIVQASMRDRSYRLLYPVSLYKRLCSAYDLSKKDAIIWGTCNEKVAIEKCRTFGDAVVEPTGIWLHCNGVLGSSPDGLIRRPAAFGFSYQNPGLADILEMSNVKPEILEVKCPFSAKNMTIPEAIEKVHDFCLGNNSVGSGF
ncbi:uncharacterized protein LOC134254980 isoform X2 [Saccostrea cucullata]|uniref:uncharacterized protein LOC134254980 isoform X2 n=1 Tax=Saccostrea cuccullata TaxID=36930 RepID=UPI002ED68ACF